MKKTTTKTNEIKEAAKRFVLYNHTIKGSSFAQKHNSANDVTKLAEIEGDEADQFVRDTLHTMAVLPQEETALTGFVYNQVLGVLEAKR